MCFIAFDEFVFLHVNIYMMKKEEEKFYGIVDGKEVPFEVPVDGSLGLLAYGDLGLIAWRKVKNESGKKTNINSGKEEEARDGKE